MRTKPLLLLAVPILAVLTPTPTGASPTVARPATSTAPRVSDALRALDRLRSYGYTWTSDAGALRAVKAWQRANGLVVDGVVGPQTLASLDLGATATAPARRLDPPAPQPALDVEGIIRDVWPDQLEDRAVAIAMRESRLQPEVINRNGDATGLFQVMWSVHRSWLCPQLGVCAQSQLQDARTNATAALALYERAGGFGPWAL
jgi:hypothetical protein